MPQSFLKVLSDTCDILLPSISFSYVESLLIGFFVILLDCVNHPQCQKHFIIPYETECANAGQGGEMVHKIL